MLKLQSVVTYYGRILALRGISLHVDPGEIVAIVGPNGAGKTTTLNTVSGVLSPRSGRIIFDGKDVSGKPAEKMVEMGLVQVPEGRQLFAEMTVHENLILGAYKRSRAAKNAELNSDLERVRDIFPILRERTNQLAGTLSGGEQQMLAIARALMARPRMLLLDEPSMGLAPLVVKEIFKVIAALRKEGGTTVLLVEQNAKAALGIAKRAYVMETGRIVMEGAASELARNPEIQRAYLGKGYKQMMD
ncbi:MAG: branched-chain amino acid ABC transporter ATP-binding protein [Armatimonadetes bacterium RBG_16_58_9]|nr:MAG: branched-chain amino acid ABC transporter ATP-binding protein [Armatimonadetes bacterium RBG_16_58_9]